MNGLKRIAANRSSLSCQSHRSSFFVHMALSFLLPLLSGTSARSQGLSARGIDVNISSTELHTATFPVPHNLHEYFNVEPDARP